MNALLDDWLRKGRCAVMVDSEGLEMFIESEMLRSWKSTSDVERRDEKMYAVLPLFVTNIRVGLYGKSANIGTASSANKLKWTWSKGTIVLKKIMCDLDVYLKIQYTEDIWQLPQQIEGDGRDLSDDGGAADMCNCRLIRAH